MINEIVGIAAMMERKIMQLDSTTHNLANASTPGFKAQHLQATRAMEANTEYSMATTVDFRRGPAEMTGNVLDLNIEGDGFFVLQTRNGIAFTRRGDFTLDRDNRLVTQDGLAVLGDGGEIRLGKGKVHVGRDGAVKVDADVAGKLRIVDFTAPAQLTRTGDGLFHDPGAAGMKSVDRPAVVSGYLERSNIDVIREMVDMIEINRTFEYYQKLIHTLTEMDKMSVSRIGRLA
jgi:flagellar basal-body rod protein FlgG